MGQSMLLTEIKEYWTGRAEGYSAVNQEELQGCQRKNWAAFLDGRIMGHFSGLARRELHILDIGAGPVSDSKLRETQKANYFSNLCSVDCAVLSVKGQSCRKYCAVLP